MGENINLNAGDLAITPFFKATQEFLGAAATSLNITILNGTTLQIAAATVDGVQAAAVESRYRYRTTNITAAHPGGSTGVYNVFLTASDNSFSGSPTVDATVYDFGLQILPTSSSPSTALYRKVGEVEWDGAQITAFRHLVGSRFDNAPINPTAPVATVPAVRARGHSGQTAPIVLVEDSTGAPLLQVGPAAVAKLVQLAANAILQNLLTASDANPAFQADGSGKLHWGAGGSSALDTALYRAAAALLKTDAGFEVGGALTVDGATGLQAATGLTRSPATDATLNLATTAFVQAAITAALSGLVFSKTTREVHVATYDDQTAVPASVGIVGSLPASLAGAQTAHLLGVRHKCTTASASVFKVQTDHAAHGTLVDVVGLTTVTPAVGPYVDVLLGTPLSLNDGDEVALVVATTGASKGCKVALLIEYSF